MSMPLRAVLPTEDRPALRLADEEATPVDTAATATSGPAAAGESAEASSAPRAQRRDGRIVAEDRATLPAACVVCGDTVSLVELPTLRGAVRYSLCHEHVISCAARAAAGVAALAVLGWLLLMGVGSRFSTLAIAALLLPTSLGLIASAVPVWTWRRKTGERQLFRVAAKVRDEIAPA